MLTDHSGNRINVDRHGIAAQPVHPDDKALYVVQWFDESRTEYVIGRILESITGRISYEVRATSNDHTDPGEHIGNTDSFPSALDLLVEYHNA